MTMTAADTNGLSCVLNPDRRCLWLTTLISRRGSRGWTERIDPEMVETFRIAGSDMTGDAFIESEAREQTEGAGQALFAMPAFFFQCGKPGSSGDVERILGSYGHGRLRAISAPL